MERRVQQTVTYEFNGVRYSRLEDMPPNVRKHFEDRDGNGIPDSMDAALKRFGESASKDTHVTRVERRTVSSASSTDDSLRRLRLADPELARAVLAHDVLETVRCAGCGYDLQGTAIGSKCPECGRPVASTLKRMIVPPPSRSGVFLSLVLEHPRLMGVLIAVVIVVVLALLVRFPA